MNRNNDILINPGLILFVLLLLTAFGRSSPGEQEMRSAPSPVLRFTPPPLPQQFSFAGEKVPLHDPMIQEQLDREVLYNYYLPNNILYIIKLSRRYFPIIEAKLKQHGIPDDMKYLCVAESNLQQLVSKAGAAGFWQFMPATAVEMGMKMNGQVDERYNIEKSGDAACLYLKKAHVQLGSWTAAAAAYNCGLGTYNKESGLQGTKNYYELLLPEETNRYIFRILTFKYILENAASLGFDVQPQHGYQPLNLKKVSVSTGIANLVSFARSNGITYKTLKLYNPWLRGRNLPAPGAVPYTILIPVQKIDNNSRAE
jgi:membrane-bound lytic murein transglycosylase D